MLNVRLKFISSNKNTMKNTENIITKTLVRFFIMPYKNSCTLTVIVYAI